MIMNIDSSQLTSSFTSCSTFDSEAFDAQKDTLIAQGWI